MKKRDDRKVKTGQVCIASSSSRMYVFNCDLLRSGNTAKECGSEPIQITGAKVRRFLLDVQQFAGQFCLSDEQQGWYINNRNVWNVNVHLMHISRWVVSHPV